MDEILPLNRLKPGATATIASLLTRDNKQLHKLMVFGLIVGVNIQLLQVSPAFILKVDNTQLAIDEDIARNIVVTNIKYSKK